MDSDLEFLEVLNRDKVKLNMGMQICLLSEGDRKMLISKQSKIKAFSERESVKHNPLYTGKFIKVEERFQPNGERREIITMDDAVACIVTNSEKDKILLIKQYREAARKECWEIPAGMLDVKGEHPTDTMLRELEEETGLTVKSVTELYDFYAMIGSCTHSITMYETEVEGVSDSPVTDDDVTERKWFGLKESYDMIMTCDIQDGKTVQGIQHLLIDRLK